MKIIFSCCFEMQKISLVVLCLSLSSLKSLWLEDRRSWLTMLFLFQVGLLTLLKYKTEGHYVKLQPHSSVWFDWRKKFLNEKVLLFLIQNIQLDFVNSKHICSIIDGQWIENDLLHWQTTTTTKTTSPLIIIIKYCYYYYYYYSLSIGFTTMIRTCARSRATSFSWALLMVVIYFWMYKKKELYQRRFFRL